MASGLQCPGCGHVHPAGLPEIARGDSTFRCYGCYRTLSVPDGWTGRPSTRRAPPPDPAPTGDAPPGAANGDARTTRLSARRALRAGSGSAPLADDLGVPGGLGSGSLADGSGGLGGLGVDAATQMVPTVGPAPAAPDGGRWSAAGTGGGWPDGGAATGSGRAAGAAAGGWQAGAAGSATAGPAPGTSPGWVSPRKSGGTVRTPIRALVWAGALGVGFLVTVFVLKKIGVLDVNTALDVYAGSGAHRFGIILVMLPVWALLSATIAHFSLEGLARRRLSRPAATRPPAETSPPT
jgi:hypothetical protein